MESNKPIGGRQMDPCKQEKSIERLDDRVTELERQYTKLSNSDSETRVYLKLLINSNEEIKLSIKEMQAEIKDRVSSDEMLAAIERIQNSLKDSGIADKIIPHFVTVMKWGLVFAAALAGIKLTL